MDALIRPSQGLKGEIQVPPDKAICQRAVLCAAFADGTTRLGPWPEADDCQRALHIATGVGSKVERSANQVAITGVGETSTPAGAPIYCGESGTTFRMSAGFLAGRPFTSTLEAGPALTRRPMKRVIEPLSQMGAQIRANHVSGESYPPLSITGRSPLKAIRYQLPVASAQVKSAILFAGLSGDGPSTVVEPISTRDHTERMLRLFGADIRTEAGTVTVTPAYLRAPTTPIDIPGDISSAAFFIVAGLCVPGSQIELPSVGLNRTRSGFLGVLERMGARIQVEEEEKAWEPRGRLRVAAGPLPLHGVSLEPEEVPSVIDELPILMVAALCADGQSVFRGLAELRVKETDRVVSMVEGIRAMGGRIEVPDGETVVIQGGPLHGARVSSAGDHRTAMSLAVAGLAAAGETRISGAECVGKSFPEFFRLLSLASGGGVFNAVDSP